MAMNVELRRSVSGSYNDPDSRLNILTDITAIEGLRDGNLIKSSLLPEGTEDTKGILKTTSEYEEGTATNLAFNQKGAKNLYDFLYAKIQNLESPIDYIGSVDVNWGTTTTYETIQNFLNNLVSTDYDAIVLSPGHAFLVFNEADPAYNWLSEHTGHDVSTGGHWIWIYNGNDWEPAIDFPEVPKASYAGSSKEDMVSGLITQEMLWKLKNIEEDAQKNTVLSVNNKVGNVTITKDDIGLSLVPNISPSDLVDVYVTDDVIIDKLGYIPWEETSASTTAEGILKLATDVQATEGTDTSTAMTPKRTKEAIEYFAGIPIVPDLDGANALPQKNRENSLVFIVK